MSSLSVRLAPFTNLELWKLCGCSACDCELSQDTYHKGCHTFGLFDQEGDQTNSTESGGLYDESKGPTGKNQIKNVSGFLIYDPNEPEEEIDILDLIESM
jgi:hypothetical protein